MKPTELHRAAKVAELPPDPWFESCEKAVPRRRPASQTVPGLTILDSLNAAAQLFPLLGLEDYVGCVTAEMRRRPVPHLFRTEEVQALTRLYASWAPDIISRVKAKLRYPVQSYNKTSRLGYPYFTVPISKMQVLLPHFEKFVAGDLSGFDDAFITYNVRLQPEPRSKVRDFMFISSDGEIYSAKADEAARTYTYHSKQTGESALVVTARTRLVFNLPILNLYKQILDTAWHHAQLEYPAFGHNMFSPGDQPKPFGFVLAFDVKHFERHTAEVCRLRAQEIGGQYAEIGAMLSRTPFMSPSDNWKRYYLIWPNRDEGWSEQYASGDSAVAPAQKDVFWAIYAEFAVKHLNVPRNLALSWVAQGGDHRLGIANYGDDNLIWGQRAVVLACFEFVGQYLHVEEELPTKFLGMLFNSDAHNSGSESEPQSLHSTGSRSLRFRLPLTSYLLKSYLNERRPGSAFRPYPYFGWVKKREAYSQLGDAEACASLFAKEDEVISRYGLTWDMIKKRAAEEAALSVSEVMRNKPFILGKDYQLTDEEKVAAGLAEPLPHDLTRRCFDRLIGR